MHYLIIIKHDSGEWYTTRTNANSYEDAEAVAEANATKKGEGWKVEVICSVENDWHKTAMDEVENE